MTTAQRRDELARLLRRRADWTTDELARDLGVSRRTVLRDVASLRERGFDISSMTGPGGGVHLEPTSVLVTSQLGGQEVVALILSVAIAQAVPWMPFARGAHGALAKIEAALPQRRAEELQRLMQRVLVEEPSRATPDQIGPIEPGLVHAFEQAFTGSRLLGFSYTNAAGRRSRRKVEPHGLLVRAPLWYVIAWDPEIGHARLFRADRIRRPYVSAAEFHPRPHELVTGVCPDARSLRDEAPRDAIAERS